MKIKSYIKLICPAGLLILGIPVTLLYLGILQLNNPDKNLFPIRGIDVSRFQGEIDWTVLKNDKIRFVFIKATEGGDYRDPAFNKNWNDSKQAGLIRGAYHFFTFCRLGKEQARNFIETVPVEDEIFPPVIDLEFDGNCSERASRETLSKELREFVLEVERVYKKQPILYVKYDTYKTYITGSFENNPIWIQDRFFYPKLPDERKWTFWQFSSRGRISGIRTYIDLNVFNGSEQDLMTLIKSH